MLEWLIMFIAEFLFIDVPREHGRQHQEKYGHPDHNPGKGLRNLDRAMFIITCIAVAAIVLALPVIVLIAFEM